MSRTYGILGVLALVALGLLGGRVWADDSNAAVDAPAALRDSGVAHVFSGSSTVDVSAATYTAYQPLVTIECDQVMADVQISLDLDQGNGGNDSFATNYTSETITFALAYKIQGNWRIDEQSDTTAIAGDDADDVCVTLRPGTVGPVEDVRVYVKVSAEQTDLEIPYVLSYKGQGVATISNVSN